MRLIECEIKAFGGIRDLRVKFSDGLNSFVAENGKGKSTLAAFVKAMLYGLSETKKQSIQENDRKHYLPWDGSAAYGTLTISSAGKAYRIERGFGKRATDDTLAVYDLKTGRMTDVLGECPGEALLSINSDGFERIAFLSERSLLPEGADSSISDRLADITRSDGGSGALDGALKILDEQRKFYYKKGGSGEIGATRAEIFRVTDEIRALEDVKRRIEETEARLGYIALERGKILENIESISERRAKIQAASACRGTKEFTDNMMADLKRLNERKAELFNFFRGRIPDSDEVDEIYFKQKSAQEAIRSRALSPEERTELMRLRAEVGGRYSQVEISEIKAAMQVSRETREGGVGKRFSRSLPTLAETDEIIRICLDKTNGVTLPMILLLLFGITLCVLGVFLGFTAHINLLLIGVPGLIAMIAGILLITGAPKRKRTRISRQINSFIDSIGYTGGSSNQSDFERLFEIRGAIESFGAEMERGQLAEAALLSFWAKFSSRPTPNPENSVAELLLKIEKFETLNTRAEGGMSAAEAAAAVAALDRVRTYLSRYDLRSNDPAAELKALVTEYKAVTSEIISKRGYLESLGAVEAPILPDTMEDSEADLLALKREADKRLSELDGEKALLERKYLSDRESLSMLDSLIAEKAKLEERLKKYEWRLKIIQSTASYLTRASEDSTSRYLDKTRKSLDRYTSLLGENSSADISTSFSTSITTRDGTHSTESLNRGDRDLYRLCARLALLDSLYGDETPFIILDDPFSSFDDERIKLALKALQRLGDDRQVIYFTCSESRAPRGSRRSLV